MEFSPEPGRNGRKAGSHPAWELGKSLCFSRDEQSLGGYLWRGRGYLLPGTSIMGQVMKERLEEDNREKRGTKITTLPEAGMTMNPHQKCERTGAAEAVLARHRHKMATFIFAGL